MQSFFIQTMQTDQTVQMHKLIYVFVGCTCQKLCFLMLHILSPVVQNLMTLLGNVTLNFYLEIWQIHRYFWLKNVSRFCSKNINVFENTLTTTANMFVINKLIKLTVL